MLVALLVALLVVWLDATYVALLVALYVAWLVALLGGPRWAKVRPIYGQKMRRWAKMGQNRAKIGPR